MDICSAQHDTVAYAGRICPACDVIEDLQLTVLELEKQIAQLKLEEEPA